MGYKLFFLAFVFSIPIWAMSFGVNGSDGRKGESGYLGKDGNSAVVTANGDSLNLDLSGENGRDGYRGEEGQDAWGCFQQTNVSYNLEGASGGDGGRGGNGGRGGDSGALTVYFEDILNLKKIYVRASPGRGGYGSYGGRGGRGCYCQVSSWVVNVGGSPQTFYCQNGRSGDTGYNGTYGENGSYGRVTLISQLQPLTSENPTIKIPVDKMLGNSYFLTKHNWESRTGAKILFANGSVLSDRYSIFLNTSKMNYSFLWNVDRPIESFSGKNLLLELNQNQVRLTSSTDFWYSGEEITVSNEEKQFIFRQAVLESEVSKFKYGKLLGNGTGTEWNIEDSQNLGLKLNHEIKIKYYVRKGGYILRWQGVVPNEALSLTEGQIKIRIGQLPIQPEYLAAGKSVLIEAWVKRSLGDKNKTFFTRFSQTLSP